MHSAGAVCDLSSLRVGYSNSSMKTHNPNELRPLKMKHQEVSNIIRQDMYFVMNCYESGSYSQTAGHNHYGELQLLFLRWKA